MQILSYGIATFSNDEVKFILWNIMFLNDILNINCMCIISPHYAHTNLLNETLTCVCLYLIRSHIFYANFRHNLRANRWQFLKSLTRMPYLIAAQWLHITTYQLIIIGHHTITWINFNLSSKAFCGIYLKAFHKKEPMNLICGMFSEITLYIIDVEPLRGQLVNNDALFYKRINQRPRVCHYSCSQVVSQKFQYRQWNQYSIKYQWPWKLFTETKTLLIESTKTTSMEVVSTGVLEKVKNIEEV